ncbi:hypothetical protein [Chryseobacterium bernardetii]|uniref:hypothetical protein n=1 Tax=Chryseobacterium bernardetii TaxID=1241978 RepID=UPI00162799B4|nr:hypothetical protein [Chryseobacterium bernardetii]
MKSNRLEILENSLVKKEAELQKRFDNHFDTWKLTNGQPMNDKRSGGAFFKKIEKQNDSIRNQQTSIEKTKNAIEREKGKIANVEAQSIPAELQELIDSGKITQWRKYPNRFFVVGVEKARLVWLEKEKQLAHQYLNQIPNKEQYSILVRKKFGRYSPTKMEIMTVDDLKCFDVHKVFIPVLYDLSYLTKEIEHEGRKFIPMHMLKNGGTDLNEYRFLEWKGYSAIDNEQHETCYCPETMSFYQFYMGDSRMCTGQYEKFQLLLKWHFNVFQLPEDQFINKATLTNK